VSGRGGITAGSSRLCAFVAAAGLMAGASAADTLQLNGDLIADGGDWTIDGVTISPWGAGRRDAPWVYDFSTLGHGLDLHGYNVTAWAYDDEYMNSVMLRVAALTNTPGGGADGTICTGGDRGGGRLDLIATAGGVEANRLVTSQTGGAAGLDAGDLYVQAPGSFRLAGHVNTRSEAYRGAGGDVTIAAAGVAIGCDAGGFSIRADAYRQRGGGSVELRTGGDVALAGGIDCRGNWDSAGKVNAGSVSVHDGARRAGNVSVGGDILLSAYADGSSYGAAGGVAVRAGSLAVSGNIDARACVDRNDQPNDGVVDVDVTGAAAVAGWIDVSNDSTSPAGRAPAGEVRIRARDIRIEGAGAGALSVKATAEGVPDLQLRSGAGSVTLEAAGIPDAIYDHTKHDPDDPDHAPLGGDASSVYLAGGVRTSYQGREDACGDVTIEAVGLWLGGDIETEGAQGSAIDVDYGSTDHGWVTHVYERSQNPGGWVQWDGAAETLNTYTAADVRFDATVPYLDVLQGGDADRDGDVDVLDLTVLANHLGISDPSWADGDFNGDAAVDVLDLSVLANRFGYTAGAGAQAPEPAALALLPLAALAALRRRRRGGWHGGRRLPPCDPSWRQKSGRHGTHSIGCEGLPVFRQD